MIIPITHENALEVFKKNDRFRKMIFEEALDAGYEQSNIVINYFYRRDKDTQKYIDTLDDYYIDYNGGYVRGKLCKRFFNNCLELQNDYKLFNDDLTARITRAAETVEKYEDFTADHGEITDADFYNLETWLKNVLTDAGDAIADYCVKFFKQYDDENILIDFYMNYWLDSYGVGRLGVDETGTVYEKIMKKIC